MKPSLLTPCFSRYVPRQPADYPVRIRLTQTQYDRLGRVAEAVCPPSRGSVPGGVAEAVRRAIDFLLANQQLLERIEPSRDALDVSISARLTREQIDTLDAIAQEYVGRLDNVAARAGRPGPQSYRGGLIRAAIDVYLARAPEVKKGQLPDMGTMRPSGSTAKVKRHSRRSSPKSSSSTQSSH